MAAAASAALCTFFLYIIYATPFPLLPYSCALLISCNHIPLSPLLWKEHCTVFISVFFFTVKELSCPDSVKNAE